MSSRLSKFRVNDRVLTNIALSFYQAESCAPYIAPPVSVPTRAGKIISFPKDLFAVRDTRRAPCSKIERSSVATYDNRSFFLEQHAHAAEVCFEEVEEAENGEANIDLKEIAVMQAMQTIEQSWEAETIEIVTNPANYEAGLSLTAAPADQFSNGGSDPEAYVRSLKELIRGKIGIYPNSAVVGSDIYNALTLHPKFREQRLWPTTPEVADFAMISAWLGLNRGMKVAQRLKLDESTGDLVDMWPAGTMLLFYSPEAAPGSLGTTKLDPALPNFAPIHGLNRTVASYAYTYTLAGTPTVGQERVDLDYRTFVNDVIWEGKTILVSIGDNNLSTAGVLVDGLI